MFPVLYDMSLKWKGESQHNLWEYIAEEMQESGYNVSGTHIFYE